MFGFGKENKLNNGEMTQLMMIISLARILKVSPKDLDNAMHETNENTEYLADMAKAGIGRLVDIASKEKTK